MSYYDEYYCPKCGAILNNQYGFDPDSETWTCTECGEMLIGDDIYNGDTFDGVAWYCDNCGKLLNRQEGFSDIYGSWRCTECGHINGTTSSDIINGFKCPQCGATLDVQYNFQEYYDNWECTECGAYLHHNYSGDDYVVIKHICPNCDAPLDIQTGFSEYNDNWECTECGAHLHHGYSSDDYVVISHICPNCDASLDMQYGFSEFDDYWKCTECGSLLHHYYSDDEYTLAEDENDTVGYETYNETKKEPFSINYCALCGAKLNNPQKFCPFCGAKIQRFESNQPNESLDVTIKQRIRLKGTKNNSTETSIFVPHLNKSISIAVPNQTKVGQVFKLYGQGITGKGGRKGDLLILITEIEYLDIEITKRVVLNKNRNGFMPLSLYLTHLGKAIVVSIPNNIKAGDTIRLKGVGLQSRRGEQGDLYLHIDGVQ